uniref:Glutathione S-transferase delta 3 n=1 Tax=Meteorus pulchricornis TaxID=51522 RepID=A0A4D6J456_9HYME|nr:glutathione S-transferase delta 3 [Meteorus pulchricornis]
MTCDLYYAPISSPCRAVMLTAEAIGLSLNYKPINTIADEQLDSDYSEINSIKIIPLLIDGDYELSEGPAIMCYLMDMYGENSQLYPKSINARALVHQRLHFDIGNLHKAVSLYYYPVALKKELEYDETKYERLKDRFATLDKYLEGHDYATGRYLTIADLALIASVTTAEVILEKSVTSLLQVLEALLELPLPTY